MIRPLAAAGLCGLLLAACSQGGTTSDPSDPHAGLDPQILAWRNDLEANHVACKAKVDGHGCDSFEVTCKAMQEITPEEAAKGVTAQVVAAMSFNGRSGGGQPGSAFALFSKAGGQWSRAEAMPVNMNTCAPV
ncbi:hypothetical protein [uncultured Phenylobacterium sp.]|uniref:hypothetical protein n=1 Tax=uncultured Phenylobacterium sp. TaxID=349273 RepID=UPI0025F73897|nr:hypothetical protein [uncultured Phenylobacterium sp.]